MDWPSHMFLVDCILSDAQCVPTVRVGCSLSQARESWLCLRQVVLASPTQSYMGCVIKKENL